MKKLTKKGIIQALKKECTTNLEKRVLRDVIKELINYNGTIQEKFEKLFSDYSHGCSSGAVNHLIYYKDTERFFNRYKKDIVEILEEDIKNGLFELKYYEDEKEYYPVVTFNNCESYIKIVEYSNMVYTKKFNTELKNILAWYSFESVCYKLDNVFQELIDTINI